MSPLIFDMQELSNKAKVTLPPRSLELPRDAADGGQMTNAPLCDELKAINAAIAAHIATIDANNVVGGTAGQDPGEPGQATYSTSPLRNPVRTL